MKKTTQTRMGRLIAMSSAALIMIATLSGCGDSASSAKYDSDYAAGNAMASESYAYDDYAYEDAEYAEEGFDSGSGQAEDVEVTEGGAQSSRKLIRTVNLNVETNDFDSVTATVPTRVNALGGYIESSSVDGSTTYSGRSADYTIRIPAAKADGFIATIGDSSNITHQTESMEDVTLKYVDIKSRKGSLQVEYDRLEELLKDADGIEELIYIENRLSEVRYEIESIEAQLRSYDNLVDYTTIYLYVSEVVEYTEPEPVDNSVGARISRGLKEAFENIGEFLGNLLVFIVVALPYLAVIAVIVLIVFLIVKLITGITRKHRAKHPKQPPMAPMQMNQPVQTFVQQPGAPVQAPGANVPGDDQSDK